MINTENMSAEDIDVQKYLLERQIAEQRFDIIAAKLDTIINLLSIIKMNQEPTK